MGASISKILTLNANILDIYTFMTFYSLGNVFSMSVFWYLLYLLTIHQGTLNDYTLYAGYIITLTWCLIKWTTISMFSALVFWFKLKSLLHTAEASIRSSLRPSSYATRAAWNCSDNSVTCFLAIAGFAPCNYSMVIRWIIISQFGALHVYEEILQTFFDFYC